MVEDILEYKFRSHIIESKLGIHNYDMHLRIQDGLVTPLNCSIKGLVFCLLDVYKLMLFKDLIDFGLCTFIAREILSECVKEDMFTVGNNTTYISKGIEITVPIASVVAKVHIKLLYN